jgi:hypothetical protein
MHIYAFGSLCRGELDFGSDVDMLAITEGFDSRFDPEVFSIYSYKRIRALWQNGNPFAWHLAIEARLIFAADAHDFLKELGTPAAYTHCAEDCRKFLRVYDHAIEAIIKNECSLIFELSAIFLAIRNFATCFSLGVINVPIFSRHSAKMLGERSLVISDNAYKLLERSRILSTRATGLIIERAEATSCVEDFCQIGSWMNRLLQEIPENG